MIDAPHGLTLTTTAEPRPEPRRTITRPVLTVERGPRDAGRSGVTLEPADARFAVFVSGQTAPGVAVLYLCAVKPDGAMDADAGRNVVAEVRLTGVGLLAERDARRFLYNLSAELRDTGYQP